MTIYSWPDDWYRFSSTSFMLRSINFAAPHRWTGGSSIYGPVAQLWVVKLTMATQAWDVNGQEMAAFLSRLGGQSGLMRFGDPMRRKPLRDRTLAPESETWSDATLFDDGTGFVSGLLPDFVTLYQAVEKAGDYLVLAGLPASQSGVLRRGDLIELRPNGIPTGGPNLYEVQYGASTDASGRAGVKIRPPLRQGFAAGDMAVIKNAMSVFRLSDDEQGGATIDPAGHAEIGFSLVEAIDQA